ncbi:MAG: protein-disulfide reductase DsbD family protein [Planctomycetota bacterium]|jgi:thiol:disulfide interchange protein DsbD
MHRNGRARFIGLTILSVLALLAAPAIAAPENPGKFEIQARLEPADLGPGESGFLVVTAKIERGLHVYATDSEALAWRPVPVEGVGYTLPGGVRPDEGITWEKFSQAPGQVEWTPPHDYTDPNFPEEPPFPVWSPEGSFVIKVPVILDAAVAPGTKLGLVFEYSSCDEFQCYLRVGGQEALATVGEPTTSEPAPGPGEAGGAEAPAAPPVPAAPPSPQVAVSSQAAKITLEAKADEAGNGEAVVTFEPGFGYHLYFPGSSDGDPIKVEALDGDGIRWGAYAIDGFGEFAEPYELRIPFERADATRLRIQVGWQACDDAGMCLAPQTGLLQLSWSDGQWTAGAGTDVEPPGGTEPAPTPPPSLPQAEDGEMLLVLASEDLPFDQVLGDELGAPRQDGSWRVVEASAAPPPKDSWFKQQWDKYGLLVLGPIFLIGLGLALTPCVLPIIPLTISVIGGGNPDIPKPRLTLLLTVYVLGLSLVYGVAGAASAAFGKAVDVEAAFRNPAVLWSFAGVFLLLAIGMLGIIEMQPPAWMEKMRGGAQRRSGTIIGSFLLGAMAAVIASPCTGPVIVGMLAFTTQAGSVGLGFMLFFTLGLGLGAVFFAAGSLNLLMRPGPWMVYVRYFFGVVLVGVALYYVADPGLIGPIALFTIGFVIAAVTGFAVARHLVNKEGEVPATARFRGFWVAIALVLTTGLVAMLTRQGLAGGPDGWIKVRDVAHLQEEVARAKAEGRPVVVDVWAIWCKYCKEYDKVIERDPYLREAFDQMVRLKIDVEKDAREDLRAALGLPAGQPKMVFFDEQGRIRRAADIQQWYGGDSGSELRRRVDLVFNRAPQERASSP